MPEIATVPSETDVSGPIPLRIDNTVLAFALYIAGLSEWCPPTNTYNETILSKLGFKGKELEESAKAAWERAQRDSNFRGHVEYYIEKAPELEYLLKAFNDQETICKAEGNDSDAGAAIREIMRKAAGRLNDGETVMDEREALLRIAVVLLKVRPVFISRWKTKEAARLDTSPPSKAKDLGTTVVGNQRVRTVQHSGMASNPLFASPELKQRIESHGR